MKHTPGPWTLSKGQQLIEGYPHIPALYVVNDANGEAVAYVTTKEAALKVAAAPELLEALKALEGATTRDMEAADPDTEYHAIEQLDAARAAIAKAEGK